MNTQITGDQTMKLRAKLSTADVRDRKQGGRKVHYVEAWKCIEKMNDIFGFAAWSSEIVNLECVASVHLGGEGKAGRYNISYLAQVDVTVSGARYRDTGTGHGQNMPLGDAHESASKEAVSDAMKRTMRHLGYQFGLALYDKEFANVVRESDAQASEDVPSSSESGAESTAERQPTTKAQMDVKKAAHDAAVDPTAGDKKGIAAFIAACQTQKHRIGPEAYYRVLGENGWEKSNEVFAKKDQKKVFDQFLILPTMPFPAHVSEIQKRYVAAGHLDAYRDWWGSLGMSVDEVPDDGMEAIVRALYEQLQELK